ncbi:transformation/transcription domain-associated protein [Teratosphaeria destructans]|uniref:Transformation/transcription domain-associated protein n=1 Tax=Teratosphaeria destructans TaxID=418781 RepID=A0A9W7W3L5_9PEZI|nr:transformation/transcription domain-associated protein [Teratosphaeria destructans]
MAARSLDEYEAKLQDASVDQKIKAQYLTELRDGLDNWCSGSSYGPFLQKFIPLFLQILSGPPVFISTSQEQKVRSTILEIVHRLPLASTDSGVIEPHADKIVETCLGLVRVENEENAVLCLKIVMDFCRYFAKSSAVAEKTQPFLELILEIFEGMEQTVKDTFDSPVPASAAANAPGTPGAVGTPGSPVSSSNPSIGSDPSADQQTTRQLAKGMQSFKVVAECPIIVVSIFQAHRSLAPKNVGKFTPKIRSTLMLQAGPQKRAHEEAESRGVIFTGIAKEIKLKGQTAAFGDLVTAQVKTMSFLAYLLRAYQSSLTEFLNHLPGLTVRLLRDVPRSHTATRKELLVAIRHIINFNFRSVFLPSILPLLDARTLVGDSLTADVSLRPLAYTMLADLIHHVREQLTPDQIHRVVTVYVGHLTGDDGVEVPGTSYQTMSAKLLLNMAECMSKVENKKDARFLMMTVLNGIADKFAAMNRAYPNAVKLARQQLEAGSGLDAGPENFLAERDQKPDWDQTDLFSAMPIKALNPRDRANDAVTENQFLFRNLLHGLKTFFYTLKNTNPQKIKDEVDHANAPLNWADLSYGFEAEEVEILIKLFREGAKCFQYYAPLDQSKESENIDSASNQSLASSTASSKVEKDLLETFATIFHHLDPATFHEIFTSRTSVPDQPGASESGIEFLYEQSFKHNALLHIPQFLLASEATSPAFCGMLLRFLMSKLEEVGEKDSAKTNVLLRLFKLSFMAVTLFSQHNESVLLPHVRELITRSIEMSVTADEPTNYFLLLRSLFRSIGGGRFEHLYKEILPLLEMLLEVLNTQLAAAKDAASRDLFVELSLTVPARLSHLLPHLSYLMRPLTVALRSGERTNPSESRGAAGSSDIRSGSAGSSELTAQGLRTLELCVDNLTADYLDPIMQPWMEEIMGSLWRMLKPGSLTSTSPQQPGGALVVTGHQGAHTAVRILGKLGGRNRRFLTEPPELEWRGYADDEASVDVRLIGAVSNGGERAMPVRLGVDTAVERLWEPVPKAEKAKKSDEHYKRQAYKLVTSHVKLLIGSDDLPHDFARLVRLQANDLADKKFDTGIDLFSVSERQKSSVKRDAQQATLLKLLRALMYTAGTSEILRDESARFLQGIYRHFMLVELSVALAREKHKKRAFDVRSGEGPVYIETALLADAICDSLASDLSEVRDVAEHAIQTCFKIAVTIFGGSEERAEKLPFFHKLAECCVHFCYEEEWFTKSAGALGISLLINRNKIGFTDSWIAESNLAGFNRLLDLIRGLLYVIKDMPQDLPAGIRLQAKDAIVELVRRFGSSDLAKQGELKKKLEDKTDQLHQIANRLIAEVSHMNCHVREAAQLALRSLADALGMPIHELVNPVKDVLIQPIFNKPLRALPFAAQIGYIDAINFLLDMENDVLTFGEELNRLLYETLALVDADDESLAQKPYEYRTAESIVRLRVAGLKLLTTAIRFPGFAGGQQQQQGQSQGTPSSNSGSQGTPQQPTGGQHRARVISIFFKSLYSKNRDVAAAANAGLKIVLAATQKLPKDLLQNGLRPILMNVQDPRKLSVEGLEGLRTLLQLLTNYFKVEIGTRLLDHMRQIADPQTLQKVSFGLIESQPKMKVVSGIFSVFHLLPSAAVSFLSELVDRVLTLEANTRRTRSSPFREPLMLFLNHYPKEAWEHFASHLKEAAKGRFFAQVLAHEENSALRDYLVNQPDAFVSAFANDSLSAEEKAQAQINAIHAAQSVCSFAEAGKKLVEHGTVRSALVSAAKNVQSMKEQRALPHALRLAAVQSSEQIMRVLVVYMQSHHDDLNTLFSLLDLCTNGELQTSPTLFSFLYKHVITSEDVEFQRKVMHRCIDVFTEKGTSQKFKWFAFHNVMNPIMANDVMRNWDQLFQPDNKGTTLLNKAMTDAIHNKLWKPQSVADISDDGTQGVDHSRMELLQASAFLVKYHHNMLQDARKDLIKFGWNYIRLEDHINKYGAYALIAYFIAHYETPPKIAMQVYNTLLRAHQAEGKNLVMQSLEILEPVLKKRLGGPDGRQSVWARLPRKILTEEVSNVPQLTSIYHFLVRHPDLFYQAREGFATVMISTISKVAQLPSPSVEARRLALNIFNLMWQWEEKTIQEQGSLAGADSPDGRDGLSPDNGKKGGVANSSVRLALIKYMVQFVAVLPERFPVSKTQEELRAQLPMGQRPSVETVTKSLDLLFKLLSPPYWDDLDIDAMFPKVTEQILCADHKAEEKLEVWTMRMVNVIQILKILVNSRSNEWIVARLPQLQKLLMKPLKSDSIEVQLALHNADLPDAASPKLPPLLQRILEAIPVSVAEDELPDADSPTEEFTTFLTNSAGESLNNGSHMAGINLLWIMAQRKPEDVDHHIPALLKTLQTKLAKDHINAHVPPQALAAQGMPPPSQPSPQEVETTTNLIIKVIEMLSARISTLGEQRRPYLSVLASLVERSHNNALCEKILMQVESWVFNPTEPVPTLKEKTAVLQKMLLFEHRPDLTLYGKFMDLVIRIYEDPKILRSELAVRMEHAFLIGLRSPDIEMRSRFMTIFDRALSRSTSNRFFKLISEQQWDILGDTFWLSQIIHLMFGTIDHTTALHLHPDDFRCLPISKLYGTHTGDARAADVMLDNSFESVINGERHFMNDVGSVRARDLLVPLGDLQHTDNQLAHDIWVSYFPMCWSTLSKDDREDIEQGLINLLTKDFHQRQVDKRPNCVASLLEGIARARPNCKFPPHVMKFMAKQYDGWYVAASFMEDLAMKPVIDTSTVRESNLDALVEVYAQLEEADLFYGTWRRRAQFVETNAALSYEQNGIWDKAQNMYEQAQIKARTGSLPFSQGEYMLWEDQWVLCAQKLQQWEILEDFAKHENINDLFLESVWRSFEKWSDLKQLEQFESVIKAVSDAPTPRRMFFQAFSALLKLHHSKDAQSQSVFQNIVDENIQLSIKNWHKLPKHITNAHIGLLQNFQQLVELHDASVICQSLAQTNAGNLDVKSQELKVLLSTWRDRLPNLWDDINAWQELVTWRQHIFSLINQTYLSLLPQTNTNQTGNSYAYRGYHETAWIINRFAHVARKHQMPDVCITQLSKIYTLPNIEIQEAFLKLREQAKCHYQNRSELTSGLDVINNTNLNYFGQQQKAEFYTLKGMFLSRLNQKEEAHDAFGTALFFDIKAPKAWAEWGRYSDYLFKEEPTNLDLAGNAISCYLEASGQYKSAKSRKLLSRILWLLSLDNAEGSLAKVYAKFQGEHPWWYWVTFIPQLLNNLSRSEGEANVAHQILTNLAKTYPQALHFQLRTSHEDMQVIRRNQAMKEQREKAAREAKIKGDNVKTESPSARPDSQSGTSRPNTAGGGDTQMTNGTSEETLKKDAAAEERKEDTPKPKKPWEHTEALVITLRTAFPLLYASMEAMVDQIQKHFKCPPDEDAYRLIVALLNDALSYVGRTPSAATAESKLPPQTEANITRFAESILPPHIRKNFEQDFVAKKPTMLEYIQKLRKWRDKLAERLDRRPTTFHLAETTHLSGFRFVWFDEVEVPGQYLQHKDKNQDFVRIERFLPIVDLVRGVAGCHRRLKIRGHDGSIHPFAIQHPAPRHSRREERILQLFRIFNSTLAKKKESRRRNLQFHLPVMVPLSPQIRMIQDDTSYITLQGVYDDYCRRNELDKDEPTIFTMEKLRGLSPQKQDQYLNVRMEALNHVQTRMVPKDVARQYFAASYPSFDAFWLFRRQFSYQLAALTYITWTMHMTVRYPNKMSIARRNGNVWGSELLPYMSTTRPYFSNPEPVPFRLTPNLQVLMGPIHTEGIFTCALMAIARCLTADSSYATGSAASADGASASTPVAGPLQNTNCELEHHLSIFIRDEMSYWYTTSHRQSIKENELRENVQRNADAIVNKALVIAREPAAGNLPANQSVLDLVAKATNPEKLCQTDLLWMPWL